MSTRTDKLMPGDMVRPTWDDRFKTTAPTPVNLIRDRPRIIAPGDIKLEDLFDEGRSHVKTLKWTETGLVIAKDGDWLMLLFGDKYGWAPAKDFETLP